MPEVVEGRERLHEHLGVLDIDVHRRRDRAEHAPLAVHRPERHDERRAGALDGCAARSDSPSGARAGRVEDDGRGIDPEVDRGGGE